MQKFVFNRDEDGKLVYKRVITKIGFGYTSVAEIYKDKDKWSFDIYVKDRSDTIVSKTSEAITADMARTLKEGKWANV